MNQSLTYTLRMMLWKKKYQQQKNALKCCKTCKTRWCNDDKMQSMLRQSTIIIIIIIHTLLWRWLDRFMRKIYAMYVEWTKLSEIENRLLSIQLLHAVETIKLRLYIKFVHDDYMLENKYSCHSKLLQQLHFHHHSRCCSEILHDWDDDLIVCEVNIS